MNYSAEEIFLNRREKLKTLIEEKVLVKGYSKNPLSVSGEGWIFDFRSIILNPVHLNEVIFLLWQKIKDYNNIQIGGMETASIPLITGLILEAEKNGKKVNGFYIRKSRKKSGLYKQIEGVLNDDPIILIDDLINSSGSIIKQVEILEELHKKVISVVALIVFRERDFYTYLNKREVAMVSLFNLKDFSISLDEHRMSQVNPYQKKLLYTPKITSYQNVVPKSTPVLKEGLIYYGTDEGFFMCLDAVSGVEKWKFRVGYSSKGKSILSSPVIYEDIVIFGAYDGNLYALDRFYGEVRWVFSEAEYIGSSPCISESLALLFVGLEHNLSGSRGSVAAINLVTGIKVWEYKTSAFTHASPLFIDDYKVVCCGGNEGVLRMFDAVKGELVWQFETAGGSKYEGFSGFSKGDIKLAPVYDKETDTVAFCSMDGYMYVLERKTGELRFKVFTDHPDTGYRVGSYGEPIFTKKFVLFAALDKHVYCYDKKTGLLVWKHLTGGRIFSSPVEVNKSIFIGSNDGRLYELSTSEGELISTTQFSERITNKVVYDQEKQLLYIVTQTNQLYVMGPIDIITS